MSQTDAVQPEVFSKSFLAEIQTRLSEDHFQTWFTKTAVAEVRPDSLMLSVESIFVRDWIKRNYIQTLTAASLAVDGLRRNIRFSVNRNTAAHFPPTAPTDSPAREKTPPPTWAPNLITAPTPARVSGTPLNPALTFDNFVVGLSNNLPYAAAKAVAEQPGVAYNPFFIHGSVGLGKTHLLQAICHQMLKDNSGIKIRYISCETFINQFISAIQTKELEVFRSRYRLSDVLIVDDIHLLAQKERTQEEFFHTFNHLVNAGKQVVFSSDSPPQDIPSLQERLVSRFKMGLVGEIEFPDLETRVAIVKHKARIRGAEFPNEVAELVAAKVKTNIRELEGAVIEVIGYSTLNDGRPIDLTLAREALKPVLSANPIRSIVSMQDIFSLIQEHYCVTLKELQSKRRTQTTSLARHVVMYLARNHTRHSLQEIGGYLGGKDHTSVLYALRKIQEKMRSESHFRETIDNLVSQLLEGGS